MSRCTPRFLVAAIVLGAIAGAGCRLDAEDDSSSKRTIVVHDASSPAASQREYDIGERHPNRIEVVVADPRGGAAIGPSPLGALVGQSVKVQFRRDLLGQSAAAPISPTAQGPGGRAVHVVGTVRSVTGGWLVVDGEKTTYWIPQASILLIEGADPPTTSPALE